MNEPTLFSLPTAPDQFSILLPPAQLRRIDFSALEFSTARKAVIEYIQTYFPNDFNDFVTNNGIMMLVELLAYQTAVLSMRGDILANEAFEPTCQSRAAMTNHLSLINEDLRRATPASVDVACTVDVPVTTDIHIAAGTSFSISGQDNKPVTYEIFKTVGDFKSDIIIPATKQGVIAWGIEGQSLSANMVSNGTLNEMLIINRTDVLDDPIMVTVTTDSADVEWSRIDILNDAGPNDQVYQVQYTGEDTRILFGDNQYGKALLSGQSVTVNYRVGGGTRGRIGASVISQQKTMTPEYPITAPVQVTFTNVAASIGGTDNESIDDARKRAPRDFATRRAAIGADDYSQLASSYSHPVFGTVSKAVATVWTSQNANMVLVYVLAIGADGQAATPNQGLRDGLKSYLEDINVLTDSVTVDSGVKKPVDISMTVVMNRGADASVTKVNVENAIQNFFGLDNWQMGKPLYLSQLYDAINAVDGVDYVDIFTPTDNILATGQLAGDSEGLTGVGINELIVLGNTEIKYYYAAQ